jgi:hypothetical protein
MADVDRIAEVERLDERGEIVGVGVHLVAVPGLARATVTAPVMREYTGTPEPEEQHLVLPGVRTEWPAMTEDHRLAGAPVLVVDLVPSRVVIVLIGVLLTLRDDSGP